jgi:DNA-binding transcriptional regulator YiaG
VSWAQTLKQDMVRLAAKEAKKAVRRLKRQVAALRLARRRQGKQIGLLTRRVKALQRQRQSAAPVARRGSGASPGRPLTGVGVQRLRVRMKLQRGAFAKLLGVSYGAVMGWERGRMRPRASMRARLRELRRQHFGTPGRSQRRRRQR